MEETKIWSIDGNGKSATPLNTTNRMETEGLLEDILTANPDMLEDGLELVGRQTSTAGGPLDLLGVDAEGRLVVFELKRGTLNREAVAQVIDYASSLNAMNEETLYRHIEQRSGNLGIDKIDNFSDWYSDNWSDEGVDALMPPRMVLVGLGVDDTTERMVSYMAGGGVDISLLTFYGFVQESKTLLARNVEVAMTNTAVSTLRKPRTYNRKENFEKRVQNLPTDIQNVVRAAESMFRNQMRGFSATYANNWINFNLNYSWHKESPLARVATAFLEIDESNKGVKIGFHPMAIHLVSTKEFENSGVEFETSEPRVIVRMGIDHEIKFAVYSLQEWEEKKDMLNALTQKVFDAYDKAREEARANQ